MKTLIVEDRPVKLQIVWCHKEPTHARRGRKKAATHSVFVFVHLRVCGNKQWDTAGQERFHTLTESYYRNSHGVILVYDVTDRESFDRIQKWAAQIDQYQDLHLCRLLVGNKSDMESARKVTTQEGEDLAKSLGTGFVETSAKTQSNVEKAFLDIATEILHKTEFATTAHNSKQASTNTHTQTCAQTERG